MKEISSKEDRSKPHNDCGRPRSNSSMNSTGKKKEFTFDEDADKSDKVKELFLQKEFIDFDIIKGSAHFNTKPSKHNEQIFYEQFNRVFFFPFYPQFWRSNRSWQWEFISLIYFMQLFSVLLYFISPNESSSISSFEIVIPFLLIILTAVGYARTSVVFSPSGTRTGLGIDSPTRSNRKETHMGLDTALLESESSSQSSSDSEDENQSSSSSSDDERNNDPKNSRTDLKSEPKLYLPKKLIRARTLDPRHTRPASLGDSTRLRPRLWSDRSYGDHFTRRLVKVCLWNDNHSPYKKSMTIAELRAMILDKVKATSPRRTYRYVALGNAIIVSIVPLIYRFVEKKRLLQLNRKNIDFTYDMLLRDVSTVLGISNLITLICGVSTFCMAYFLFMALADAEVTYHRRLLYAKCFTALTSSRRAKQSHLPHFRLKNVVNIKAWLSLRGGRSWLKRQARQRAADEAVSSCFYFILILLGMMGLHVVMESSNLQDTNTMFQGFFYAEICVWCMLSSVFLLRFMMLGSHINRKYENHSLLLTEQMNLYLRILASPQKKEKLLLANNVVKLAGKLLKELHKPNKVSGLTMNPLLYNITRVVVLSAFSAVFSEILGFKLKLWKI